MIACTVDGTHVSTYLCRGWSKELTLASDEYQNDVQANFQVVSALTFPQSSTGDHAESVLFDMICANNRTHSPSATSTRGIPLFGR